MKKQVFYAVLTNLGYLVVLENSFKDAHSMRRQLDCAQGGEFCSPHSVAKVKLVAVKGKK